MRILLSLIFIFSFSSVTLAEMEILPQHMPPIKCHSDNSEHCEDEKETPDEPVMCTMDAKQCPDGSYVSRTGPNCEFALCPDE